MLAYSFYENDMRVQRYATALIQHGYEVDVIALRREGQPDFETVDGVNLFRVQARARNERGWRDYLLRLMRFMMVSTVALARNQLRHRYDIVHVHSVPDFLVFCAFLPKLLGAKVILDIHDILPEFVVSKFGIRHPSAKFTLLLLAERLSAQFADHVIVANDLWYDRLVRRSVSEERCTAIINYPDAEIFYPRSEQACNDSKFIVVYPGTLNHHQGLDVAIQSIAIIKDEIPDLEFHIYGEGPAKPELLKLSLRLGLSHRVFFHEFLPSWQIAIVMSGADVAVVPKRASSSFGNEAISTKVMEFMSLGVPVIVSRTAVDSYYYDDSIVRFFTSEDAVDLANAIRELRYDGELRRALNANATAFIQRNRWQDKKLRYLRLVDSLCSSATDLREPSRNTIE